MGTYRQQEMYRQTAHLLPFLHLRSSFRRRAKPKGPVMTTETTTLPATSAWGDKAEAGRFYRQVLNVLTESGIPYLVGGAYALAHYTGIHRDTKDFDIFLTRRDVDRGLDILSAAGYSPSSSRISPSSERALTADGSVASSDSAASRASSKRC